jgi:hypothetical protein
VILQASAAMKRIIAICLLTICATVGCTPSDGDEALPSFSSEAPLPQ